MDPLYRLSKGPIYPWYPEKGVGMCLERALREVLNDRNDPKTRNLSKVTKVIKMSISGRFSDFWVLFVSFLAPQSCPYPPFRALEMAITGIGGIRVIIEVRDV